MPFSIHQDITLNRRGLSRRSFLHYVSAGATLGVLGFRDMMSLQAEELRQRGMAMILLWMEGGPSQLETFDPKPGKENGGPTTAINTAVPGIRIAKGWEETAKVMNDIAIIRSMTNKEGEHQRARYQMHTGYIPSGSIRHPSLGSCIVKEIGDIKSDLPAIVSVGQSQGAGFLGVDYEPFMVNDPGALPRNVATPVATPRFERRLGLLNRLEEDFSQNGGELAVRDHKQLYEKTSRLVLSPEVKAFSFDNEPSDLKSKYGSSQFGRGCLLARRLVEAGVTFVEVRSGGWDTHQENFDAVTKNAGEVDPGVGALISDLKQRGMLDKTLVVWMGEFGRTPKINPRQGRDHYPRVFNALMAGGGVKGGQVIGASTDDGMAVKDQPVTVPDLFTSICKSLKVDPRKENVSPLGRPLKIVDGGQAIPSLLG